MIEIIKIPYKPHHKQREFHECKATFKAFIGGIGSGKTAAGVNEAIKQAIVQPGSLGVICAPTYPMLRDVTQREFFKFLPDKLIANFNKTEQKLKLINGSEILFRSLDNPERLRGLNLAWFYIDEAALVGRKAWDILVGRLRQPGYEYKAWITTTPKGFNWVYDVFVAERKQNYAVIYATTYDNPYISKDYIKELEASYSGAFFQQEILAKFVQHEGLVYPEFSRAMHVVDKLPKFKRVVAGVDWGFTNPSVILVIGVDYDNRVYVVEEFYKRRVMIEDLVGYAKQLKEKYGIDTFFCDPSEPQFIEAFKRVGLNAVQADNSLMPGIQEVSARLKIQEDGKPRLFVHSSCVNTIMEFENYAYPEAKEGKPRQEKPLKLFDHAMDALRYAVMGLKQSPPFKPGTVFMKLD